MRIPLLRFAVPIALAALLLPSCKSNRTVTQAQPQTPQLPPVTYPETRRENVADTYHGTRVEDPYRWLEDDTSAETGAWVQAQNRVTFGFLESIPFRENIRLKVQGLINYARMSQPIRCGEYYFFYKNDGLQNQAVLYRQKGLSGTPEVFIDPNALSASGTTTVDLAGFSRDHKYMALSYSVAGSDWRMLKVREVATNRELTDSIQWVKFSGAAWSGDGFYYSAYPAPAGSALSAQNQNQRVYYHRLGTSQSEDVLVYEDTQNPLLYNSVSVSEDGNWVFLTVQQGTEGNKVYYRPSSSPKNEAFKPLFDTNFTNKFGVVHTSGDTFFIYTNLNAPRYRLVTVRAGQTDAAQWRDLIPQTEYLLDGVSAAGGRLFAEYLIDATTRIFVYNTSGVREREIQLPTLGSSGAPGGWWEDEVLFYTFTSFTYPATVFKYTVATGRSEVFFQPQVAFNPADFETKQVFYTSKDGTRVPMFLVYKKGIRMDGQNPTYLYAYGGFNINLTPSFSATRMALVDMGAIFAMPNLRGGGEYGEEWHRAGMLEKKQNVFDDFIAAAEYLIRERYTSSAKLGIAGGSNGGLLVGACMTQRPDLFRVAIPKVGVLDMLRYHKFTVGWGWVPEYGSSEVPEQFPFLYKYSPYHNLRPNTAYPCTFIMTADHDDRVVPAHSFKFAAALQYAHRGPNPVLIRIETSAGHGAGKPTAKVVQETADEFAFFFRCVGVNPFARP